jgi:hypothetical protein
LLSSLVIIGSSDEEEAAEIVAPQVISTMELPEGARLSDSEDDGRPQTDPHRALNIDLEEYVFFLIMGLAFIWLLCNFTLYFLGIFFAICHFPTAILIRKKNRWCE